ncbi:MAG: hypothetical protein N3B16_04340 [Candidatus Aminicenantes bacterium]|nr:hypothetical protein [Candidatus Aminicenantes bacterium]
MSKESKREKGASHELVIKNYNIKRQHFDHLGWMESTECLDLSRVEAIFLF